MAGGELKVQFRTCTSIFFAVRKQSVNAGTSATTVVARSTTTAGASVVLICRRPRRRLSLCQDQVDISLGPTCFPKRSPPPPPPTHHPTFHSQQFHPHASLTTQLLPARARSSPPPCKPPDFSASFLFYSSEVIASFLPCFIPITVTYFSSFTSRKLLSPTATNYSPLVRS